MTPSINGFCLALSLSFSLFLCQASYAESTPNWINGASDFYPNELYLTATGSASRLELSKDRALGNLAKIIELKIQEESSTLSNTEVNLSGDRESIEKNIRLDQKININTDKVIHGARIVESYLDREVFIHHALAVLERAQATQNIHEEMRRLDKETETEFARSESINDALFSINAMHNAIDLQTQRHDLQRALKVIDLTGKGRSSGWSLAELNAQLEDKLQNLGIGSSIDHDPLGGLELALKSAMGNSGFPADISDAKFIMVADLAVQDLGFQQGWHWLRGTLSIKLIEPDGKVRGRKQWPLKVSALQKSDTAYRFMLQVNKKLNAEIKASLLAFSTSKIN